MPPAVRPMGEGLVVDVQNQIIRGGGGVRAFSSGPAHRTAPPPRNLRQIAQSRSRRRSLGQLHNPAAPARPSRTSRSRRKTQFFLGAEHALGKNPPDGLRLQGKAAGQGGAHRRVGYGDSRPAVGCPAGHRNRLSAAELHGGQFELIRLRMLLDGCDFRRHDRLKDGAGALEAFHLTETQGKSFGDFPVAEALGEVNKIRNPIQGYFHFRFLVLFFYSDRDCRP